MKKVTKKAKVQGMGRPPKGVTLSKRLYFATTEELLDRLKEKAYEERRTVTETIRICLEDYFKIKR